MATFFKIAGIVLSIVRFNTEIGNCLFIKTKAVASFI